jgi:hypothetical protein
VRAEQYDVTPGRRSRELVLEGEMAAATEEKVKRLERASLKDLTELTERIQPCLRLLASVSACRGLELGNQSGAVGFDSGSKALNGDQHALSIG